MEKLAELNREFEQVMTALAAIEQIVLEMASITVVSQSSVGKRLDELAKSRAPVERSNGPVELTRTLPADDKSQPGIKRETWVSGPKACEIAGMSHTSFLTTAVRNGQVESRQVGTGKKRKVHEYKLSSLNKFLAKHGEELKKRKSRGKASWKGRRG